MTTLRDRLASVGVSVKALEWRQTHKHVCSSSMNHVCFLRFGKWWATFAGIDDLGMRSEHLGKHRHLSAAKLACQSDYEQRVLAMLTTNEGEG